MINGTQELLLTEFFMHQAVLGPFLKNGEKLFGLLGKIFMFSKDGAESLFKLACCEAAGEITSQKDFMLHKRMKKFLKMQGGRESESDGDEAAEIKGNALYAAAEQNLLQDSAATCISVYSRLKTAARNGTVSALRISGILQCEGVFFPENKPAGIKNLKKAADWNDCASTLALLYYLPVMRPYNLARLKAQTADSPYPDLYNTAKKIYGGEEFSEPAEVRLLERAFNSGCLKREIYEAKPARILYGSALTFKDKEKSIFNPNKDQVSAISELPLKLKKPSGADDYSAVRTTCIKRKTEQDKIIRALENSDLRELNSYRPLCLCSDSAYLLNMYEKAIRNAGKNVRTERIDVADLLEYDLEPTANNVFVRSLNEDFDNRLHLYFSGDIPERAKLAARNFLNTAKRGKFHLNSPNVTLDLRSVLPVCFSDRQNAETLSSCCEIINLGEATKDETACALAEIFERKQKLYGLGGIARGANADELFFGLGIDAAEKAVDDAVRAARVKNAVVTITKDVISAFTANKTTKIGFGGNSDEN